MFNLGRAIVNLGSKMCHAEAEMLSSAHTAISLIHRKISELEAQPAVIREDLARMHDAVLTDIMNMCAAHLRKSPAVDPVPFDQAAQLQAAGQAQAVQDLQGVQSSLGAQLQRPSDIYLKSDQPSTASAGSGSGSVNLFTTSSTAGAIAEQPGITG